MNLSVFTYYQEYLDWYNQTYPFKYRNSFWLGQYQLTFKEWMFNNVMDYYFTHIL